MFRFSGSAVRKFLLFGVCLACMAQYLSAQQVAITMDDLPSHGPLPPNSTRLQVASDVVKALHEAGVPPVYGMVNGVEVEKHPETARVLDVWRKAGNPLGNHAWSHMNLNSNSLKDFENDVLANEKTIESRMSGEDWHWLRFPYLAEGDTQEKRAEVRTFLGQHMYKVAAVTMSFGDYLWTEPYARCSAKKDKEAIAFLEASFLLAAKSELHYEQALSQKLYGKEIPLVLLVHIGAFDAHMFPRLLQMYKQEGVKFITLQDAEKDPFYRVSTDLSLPPASNSLQSVAAEKHITLPERAIDVPKLENLCR